MANARAALGGINLTAAEKSSVKTINQKYADELKRLRQANGKDGVGQNSELRAQLQGLAERERAEIRAALTPEHRLQFDTNVAHGRGGRGKAGTPGTPGHMRRMESWARRAST